MQKAALKVEATAAVSPAAVVLAAARAAERGVMVVAAEAASVAMEGG